MSTTGVSFKIGADNSGALKALKDLQDEFKSLRNQLKNAVTDIKVKISTDTASLSSDISVIRNQIKNQIGEISVDVKVHADTSSIASSATQIKNQLRSALGTVDLALNLSVNMPSIQSDVSTIKTYIRNALGIFPIQITASQNVLNADLFQIRNRIHAFFSNGVAIRIIPNLTTADAATARARLQSLVSQTYQAKVGINLAYLNAQINHARSMLSSLGSGLNINIDATASSLIHALNELRQEVKRLRTAMGSGGGGGSGGGAGTDTGGSGVFAGLKASIAGLMATATGGAIAAITVQTAEYVRELEQAARLANTTTQEMQAQAYAASTVGISIDKLGDIYKDVNDKVGDFLTTGGGELKDFFEKIAPKVGVTAEQFYNLSGPDALQLFVDSLQKANVSQAEMVFYLESIANDATVLLPLLKNGGAEMQRLAEQAQKLGIILDDTSIAKAKAFQAAFGQVKSTVTGLTRTLGIELAPTLTDLSNKFVEFAINNADGIRDSINSIVDLFNDMLSVFDVVFTEIGELWSDLTGSIEDGTGVQLRLFDLLSAAFQGMGFAFRFVALLIKSLFEIIKYAVRETVLNAIAFFNDFSTQFNLLKETANLIINVLKINFKSLGEVIEAAFNLDWQGIKNNFKAGTTELEKEIKAHEQRVLAIKKDADIKQQAIAESRAANTNSFNTNLGNATRHLLGTFIGRQFDRNDKTPPPPSATNTGGSGLKGGGYVAPPSNTSKKDNAKQKADTEKREAEALANAKYDYEKKLLDRQFKDNEQRYKNEEIFFLEYMTRKDDLNKQHYELEAGYLNQQSLKATEHEKQLIEYKRKNIDLEAKERADALVKESEEYIKNMEKRKQFFLDKIAEYQKKIDNISDLDKELNDVDEYFKKVSEDLAHFKKEIGENGQIKFVLDDGSIIELDNKANKLIKDIQAKLNQQQIEIKAKIVFEDTVKQIQKQTDQILSDNQYFNRYYDIQEKSNPFKQKDINEARRQKNQEAGYQLSSKRNELQGILSETTDEEIVKNLTSQIKELDIAILEMNENSATAFQQFSTNFKQAVGDALASGLNTFFNDLIEGSKSAGEALKDFVRNFIKAIAQIIVQAMAAYVALLILNAIPGGAAIAGAMDMAATANSANNARNSTKKVNVGKNHTGGLAGSSGDRRNIDLSTYNHAPRYHTGGIAGFAPNEVPAILQRGEEVLTRDDPRHVANGGGNAGASVRIINQIQDSEIHEAVATPSGEKTIVNIIGRNAGAIRRILNEN